MLNLLVLWIAAAGTMALMQQGGFALLRGLIPRNRKVNDWILRFKLFRQ